MQYKKTLAASALATSALAAYVPGQPWSTLTPSATFKGGITDYASTFGIAVQPIATPASVAKRAVSQIGDGQVQATTKTTSTLAPKAPISQIGDGQIQATTKTQAAPVSQIGDGQIQATTKTTQAASQIGDGQVQAATKTASAASQIADGQVQQNKDPKDPVGAVSCKVDGTLQMNLKGGILTDEKGRIGSIVANRQFQFDGPPPQAGAIYAAGWSLTPQGNLALGDSDVFYQCLSGNFYNLYDQSIGAQCHPVHLSAIDLVKC